MTNKEAIEILSQCGWDGLPHGYTGGYREALDMAIEALSAERIGHWVEYLDMHPLAKEESKYICSCCRWRTRQVEANGHLIGGYGAEAIGAEWVCTEWKDLLYNYCPNCGAKMIEGEKNDN